MPMFANFEDHEKINTQTPDHSGNMPNIGRTKSINRLSKINLAAKLLRYNYPIIYEKPCCFKHFFAVYNHAVKIA